MKVVITIGTGNSGCGAVHDFLTKNTKYKSPFQSQEFRMIDDPDGILNLYYNFYKNHSIHNPSNAIMRFKNYVKNLVNLKIKINNKNVKVYDKNILSLTDRYIENITTLNYRAFPQFIGIQTNFFKRFFFTLKKKIGKTNSKNYLFKMYLPVKEDIFFKQTKNYLNGILKYQLKNNKTKHVILDQSINMWNFVNIFSYFDDVKVILITRDPRGIYNSMKNRQSKAYPWDNLKVWTDWFEKIMWKFNDYKKKIPKKLQKHVLEIKLEDFVKKNGKEQKKILNFLNISKIDNKFDTNITRFNAYKAKHELSNFEQNHIKKKLSRYLQW